MIVTLVWFILKRTIFRYIYMFDRFGLIDKATWLIYQYLILTFSFFCATWVYFVLYNMSIPTVHQQAKLHLFKMDTGYIARVFNAEGDFPLCKDSAYGNNFTSDSEHESMLNKICANPVDLGASQLYFEPETYEVSLKLILPEASQNLKVGESVSVYAEFISQNNMLMTTTTEGIVKNEKFSLKEIVKEFKKSIGLNPGDMTVDIALSKKFINSVFNTNVINVEIRNPNIVVRTSFVELKVVLGFMRGIMYRWFWTSIVMGILLITLWLTFAINLLWKFLSALKQLLFCPWRKPKAKTVD